MNLPDGIRRLADSHSWTAPLGIALVSVIAYFGVWTYGYASDDVALISRLMRDGWEGIAYLLHPATGATGYSGYERYYRPLWVLVTTAGYYVWGASPAAAHLFNLILFAITCAAVWYLVVLVTGDRRIAVWTGLLFAVHPIHTMNVIWISGRTDGLATLGVVAGVIALLNWREQRSIAWLIAGIIATLAALASKEMGYLLTPLAFVSAFAREWHRGRPRLHEAIATAVPAFSATFIWAAFVLMGSTFVSGFDWGVTPRSALENWAGALVLMASPVDYELLLPVALSQPVLMIAGSVLVTLVAGAFIWYGRRDPALLWAFCWTLIGILPLYRLTMRWYLLLPSIGMAALLAVLIRRGEQTRLSRGATVAGVLLLLLFTLGLVRERHKWSVAETVNERALSSLASVAHDRKDIVVVASPAKVRRMPVFGGNTESFLYVRTGVDRRVHVLSLLALERIDATVTTTFIDSVHVRMEIDPAAGSFDPAQVLSRRGRAEVGYRFQTGLGTATVEQVDSNGLPIAILAKLDEPPGQDKLWLTLEEGRYVQIEPRDIGGFTQ